MDSGYIFSGIFLPTHATCHINIIQRQGGGGHLYWMLVVSGFRYIMRISRLKNLPVKIKNVFLKNLRLCLLSYTGVSILNHMKCWFLPERTVRMKKWMPHKVITEKSWLWHLILPSFPFSSFASSPIYSQTNWTLDAFFTQKWSLLYSR